MVSQYSVKSWILATFMLSTGGYASEPPAKVCESVDGLCPTDARDTDEEGMLQKSRHQTSHKETRNDEYVAATYTWGAAGAGRFWNYRRTNGCFPGIRFYTEDRTSAGSPGQVDAAALINWQTSGIRHARTSVVALHWYEKSFFEPCKSSPKDDWPTMGAQDWSLHDINSHYRDRLNQIDWWNPDKNKRQLWSYYGDYWVTEFELGIGARAARYIAKLVGHFCCMDGDNGVQRKIGWAVSEVNNGNSKQGLPKGYKVVFFDFIRTEGDPDAVMLVQDPKTMDCALAFTGTNNVKEFGTSLVTHDGNYCGYTHVHQGYINELRWLGKSKMYERLKTKLPKCNKLTVTGHSLGGALAEMWTACVSGRKNNGEDFEELTYVKDPSPSVLPPIVCNGNDCHEEQAN